MKARYILLLLLIVTTIPYINALNNSFQYDDQIYVEENTNIKTISLSEVFLHPSSIFAPNIATGHYRPLVLLTYVINYRLYGLNPIGYHIVNLVFHIGSAFLLYLIIKAMLGSFYISLASALIFAVHPFNSEVVNYITARSSVMSGFFYLLAFYCWVKFRGKEADVRRETLDVRSKNDSSPVRLTSHVSRLTSYVYLSSLLAFILGMLSKEVVITLPVVLWLYDLYFIHPFRTLHSALRTLLDWRTYIPYIPFVLIVIIPYLVMRILTWGEVFSYLRRPLLVQLYTELPVLVKHLRLFIFPAGLNIDHYTEIYRTFFAWPVVSSAIILSLFITLTILFYKSKTVEWRGVSFFMVWFFVVLMPSTIVPLTAIFQENRGYLAIIPFVVFAGVVLDKSANTFRGYTLFNPSFIILVFLLLLYSIGTAYRNSVWRDGVTLWSDAAKKSPNSSVAYTNLGTEYAVLGRNDMAIKNLIRALRLANPETGGKPYIIHYNLGAVYQQMGSVDDAIREYMTVTRLNPADFFSYYNLGVLYQQRGDAEAAIEAYSEVIKRNPSHHRSYHNLGFIYQNMGDKSSAVGFYRKALSIDPDYVRSHLNLGAIYEEEGKPGLAKEEYLIALKRNPDYAPAYYNLGLLYEQEGNVGMAIKAYREAAQRNYEDRSLMARLRNLEGQYSRGQ